MDKSKIVIIVGTIFIIIALALSAASVVMMSSVLKKVNGNGVATENIENKREVPLSKTTNFNLSDPVIGVVKSKNTNKTLSLSIEIGFNLDSRNKKTKEILELMEEKEGIIRDRISKLIETKDIEYFESDQSTESLQEEILQLISMEFDTDTIIEVYFNNNLKSMR